MATATELLKSCTCPWCETAGLKIAWSMYDTPNGPASLHTQGYHVVCAGRSCPNTTGVFPTEIEAAEAALEYCKEMGTA